MLQARKAHTPRGPSFGRAFGAALLACTVVSAPAAGVEWAMGHDPLLGVVTTAGGAGTDSVRTESAQLGPTSGMAMTGAGVAAGGGVALGVVAAAGGGGSSSDGGSGGDDGGSDDGGSDDGSDPTQDGSDSDLDGGDDDAEAPDGGSGPSEPEEEDTSDGPLSFALAGHQARHLGLAGGGRLTVTHHGPSTALYLTQPVGIAGGHLTLASQADPARTGGFYARQDLPADLLLQPGVIGATHLKGFGRLSGATVSLPRGPGRLRLAAFAGQPANGPAWGGPSGAITAAGYDLAAPGWHLASDLALARTSAGQPALSTGTRFAANLGGGTSFLAGATAHAGALRDRGQALLGLTATSAEGGAKRRLGLIAARTWSQATERAGMSKTSGNGFDSGGSPSQGRFSLQAFWQESLGARAELGLGTHWAPAYGDRPEHSSAAGFVAKLTGDF